MRAIRRIFDWKLRGIRWVEIIGASLVAVMILSVYAAKTAAARENARIAQLERDIASTNQRVRLLRAEAARLEQPARLEALSRIAGLEPVDVRRRVGEADLEAIAPETTVASGAASAPTANGEGRR